MMSLLIIIIFILLAGVAICFGVREDKEKHKAK
jgi:hypothetical protein